MAQQKFSKHLPIILVFLLCFSYWFYLALICQMLMVHDSLGYQFLGRMIAYNGGWLEYFKSGPNREPVYPALVALSMKLGDLWHVGYQSIQIVIQFGLLFLTQLLTLVVLRKLKFNKWLTLLVILYLGISPGFLNSALWLYSEISLAPFILIVILAGVRCWQVVKVSTSKPKIIACAVLFGFILALTVMAKAVFQVLGPLLMALFLIPGISAIKKEKKLMVNGLIFFIFAMMTFQGLITAYKFVNKKFNDNFSVTDRGPWALYGDISKRADKWTLKRYAAIIAYIPCPRLCFSIFDDATCRSASYEPSDAYGYGKLNELTKLGMPRDEMDKLLVKLALQKFMQNPPQQFLIMFIESLKMLFWETPRHGQVTYPTWLEQIYKNLIFEIVTTCTMALLMICGLIHSLRLLWKRRKEIYETDGKFSEDTIIILLIITIALPFAGIYSLFTIVPRYALSIVPIYLIMIAHFLQTSKNKARHKL